MNLRALATRALAATVLAAAAVIATPAPASANFYDCYRAMCLTVRGKDLHVDTLKFELVVPASMTYLGHVEVWGPDFHYDTQDQQFTNYDRQKHTTFAWSPMSIDTSYANGDKICTRFWRLNDPGDGSYTGSPKICATIHD